MAELPHLNSIIEILDNFIIFAMLFFQTIMSGQYYNLKLLHSICLSGSTQKSLSQSRKENRN